MHLVVDIREAELLTQLRLLVSTVASFRALDIRTASLPLADLLVMDDDGTTELVAIERKALADLHASIRDGRYEEQSYRLNGWQEIPNHNIVYLVEGDMRRFGNRFKGNLQADQLTLYSAMFSLNYYKGFSVMRTFSMEETAMFVCNMVVKMAKEKQLGAKTPYYKVMPVTVPKKQEEPEPEQKKDEEKEEETEAEGDAEAEAEEEAAPVAEEPSSERDYVCVVKKVKKDNVTVNNIAEIMLCQIPGISSVTAAAIMERYQSLPNLLTALEASRAAGEKKVADITYTNSKGQTRRISQTILLNLSKFLLK